MRGLRVQAQQKAACALAWLCFNPSVPELFFEDGRADKNIGILISTLNTDSHDRSRAPPVCVR